MDAYAVLGVHPGASDSEIRDAYVRRSKELHPDRFAEASESERALATRAMQQLNVAYDELRHRDPPSPPLRVAPPPRPVYVAPPRAPRRPPRRGRWVVVSVALVVVATLLVLTTGDARKQPLPTAPGSIPDLSSLEGECITIDTGDELEDIVECTRPHDARVVKVVEHGVACPVWADARMAGPRQDLCLDRV